MLPIDRPRTRAPAPAGVLVLGVTVFTLILSPIIAVWAVVLGTALCLVGGLRYPTTGSARGVALAIGIGLVLGAAPYFALALVQ